MSPRKPPALANWLLDRSGLAAQNPPLAGDLLEEFRNGRSAAWFWRQTLAVMVMGMGRNVRLFKRYLIANIIVWAAETGVSFALWWHNVPRQLHGRAEMMAACLVAISVIVPACWMKVFLSKRPLTPMSTARKEEVLGLWDGSSFDKAVQRRVLLINACVPVLGLTAYCVSALFCRMTSGDLVVVQAEALLLPVMRALVQPPDVGLYFTTLK
jgi:hypothetical protein